MHKPPKHLRTLYFFTLFEKLCVRKNHGFHLRSLPTHHHATGPVTIEDDGKKGLQICSGDLVSFFPLCCAFGVPMSFLFVFVGPQPPLRQLSAHMDALHHIRALHHIYAHTETHIILVQGARRERRQRQSVVLAPGGETTSGSG